MPDLVEYDDDEGSVDSRIVAEGTGVFCDLNLARLLFCCTAGMPFKRTAEAPRGP